MNSRHRSKLRQAFDPGSGKLFANDIRLNFRQALAAQSVILHPYEITEPVEISLHPFGKILRADHVPNETFAPIKVLALPDASIGVQCCEKFRRVVLLVSL